MRRKYIDDRPFIERNHLITRSSSVGVLSCIKQGTLRTKSIFASKLKLDNIGSSLALDQQLDEFFSRECDENIKHGKDKIVENKRYESQEKVDANVKEEKTKLIEKTVDADEGWYSRDNSDVSDYSGVQVKILSFMKTNMLF